MPNKNSNKNSNKMSNKNSKCHKFPKSGNYTTINQEIITKFADLEINVSYLMSNMRTIPTKTGQGYVADFETEEGEQYTVWMPESLIKKFNALQVDCCFVWNGGKKEWNGKSYFDTKLLNYN